MVQDRLDYSVHRLLSFGNGKPVPGTAWFISPDLLLTAAHCIGDRDARQQYAGPFQLKLPGGGYAAVYVLRTDWDLDVALLKLKSDPATYTDAESDWACSAPPMGVPAGELGALPTAGLPPEARWYGWGFPDAHPDGLAVNGVIDSLFVPVEGQPALQLTCNQGGLGHLHGLSGGPVCHGSQIVALIRFGPPQLAQRVVMATALKDVAHKFPEVSLYMKPSGQIGGPFAGLVAGLPPSIRPRIERFVHDYLGTPEQPMPFGGRTESLAELMDWLADTTARPFMLLVAPTGAGKSALLCHLAQALTIRQGYAVFFFPVSHRYQTTLQESLFLAICGWDARLRGTRAPSSVIEADVCTVLQSPPPDDVHTLVFILDGVDERANWSLQYLFPRVPQPRVRFIISARRAGRITTPQALGESLGIPAFQFQGMSLGLLSRTGVADVLASISTSGSPGQDELINQLYERSGGEPLTLGLLLRHVALTGRAGQGTPVSEVLKEAESRVPSGLREFWRAGLTEQEATVVAEPRSRAVLCILSSALAPLSVDDLAAMMPNLNRTALRKMLEPVARLLIFFQDGQDQYVFAHDRLRETFIEEELSRAEYEEGRMRLRAFAMAQLEELKAGRLRPSLLSAYALRYLSTHLSDDPTSASALMAIVCQPWRLAWEKQTGSLSGFLTEVNKAWQMCRVENEQALRAYQFPDVASEVRCALWTASIKGSSWNCRARLLAQLVRSKARSPEWALAYIEQMSVSWPRYAPKRGLGRDVEGGPQRALEAIVPLLPQRLLGDALRLALLVDHGFSLLALIPRLLDAGYPAVDLAAKVRTISEKLATIEPLAMIGKHAAPTPMERLLLLRESLELCRNFEYVRNHTLHLHVLIEVAARVTPEERKGCWAEVEQILAAMHKEGYPKEYVFWQELRRYAPSLEGQAMTIARFGDTAWRHFPMALPGPARLAWLACHIAGSFDERGGYTHGASYLISDLPEEELDLAFAIVCASNDPMAKVDGLLALASRWRSESSEECLRLALAAVPQIQDSGLRLGAMHNISKSLEKEPVIADAELAALFNQAKAKIESELDLLARELDSLEQQPAHHLLPQELWFAVRDLEDCPRLLAHRVDAIFARARSILIAGVQQNPEHFWEERTLKLIETLVPLHEQAPLLEAALQTHQCIGDISSEVKTVLSLYANDGPLLRTLFDRVRTYVGEIEKAAILFAILPALIQQQPLRRHETINQVLPICESEISSSRLYLLADYLRWCPEEQREKITYEQLDNLKEAIRPGNYHVEAIIESCAEYLPIEVAQTLRAECPPGWQRAIALLERRGGCSDSVTIAADTEPSSASTAVSEPISCEALVTKFLQFGNSEPANKFLEGTLPSLASEERVHLWHRWHQTPEDFVRSRAIVGAAILQNAEQKKHWELIWNDVLRQIRENVNDRHLLFHVLQELSPILGTIDLKMANCIAQEIVEHCAIWP